MEKGRGGCTGLGGGEGVCSLETLSRELKESCGEIDPLEEEFDIFFMEVKVLKKDCKDTKGKKIEEETFPI